LWPQRQQEPNRGRLAGANEGEDEDSCIPCSSVDIMTTILLLHTKAGNNTRNGLPRKKVFCENDLECLEKMLMREHDL
jgi:hypothetical protein